MVRSNELLFILGDDDLSARAIFVLGTFAAFAGANDAHAVRFAEPPSQELAAAPGSSLVSVRVVSIGDPVVEFRRVEKLRGERTPRKLALPVDPETRASLAVGERYLVGVADQVLVKLPGGKRHNDVPWFLFHATTVGEVICRDEAPCRTLLTRSAESAESEAASLASLLGALESRDAATSRLAAAEIATRRALHPLIDRAEGKRLYVFATDAARDPRARTLLLELGEAIGPARTGPWVVDAAREILAAAPLSFESASMYAPALVAQALQVLARAPRAAGDAELASRWVDCAHAGVVELALETRVRIRPSDSLAFVEARLAAGTPNAEVRTVLEQHRRRLEVMDTGSGNVVDGPDP